MNKILLLKDIRDTKDKNLYFTYRRELNSNFYSFVEVIKIFKDDFKFIFEIAEDYLQDVVNADYRFIELSILLAEFVPEDSEWYELCKNRLDGIYSAFLFRAMVKSFNNDISKLGFSLLQNEYRKRKTILDYFAKRMMKEIYFCNSLGTLEDLIHLEYDDFKDIKNEGYENFFIRNLTNIDYSLGNYIKQNKNFLNELLVQIEEIEKNWDFYKEELLRVRVMLVNNWVEQQVERKIYGDSFDYNQAFMEVVCSLKLSKLFFDDINEVKMAKSSVIAFSSLTFKRDLKSFIEKVFDDKVSLSQLKSFKVDEESPKKLLKQEC